MAVTLYRQVGKGKARRYQKVNLGRGRRPADLTGPYFLRYSLADSTRPWGSTSATISMRRSRPVNASRHTSTLSTQTCPSFKTRTMLLARRSQMQCINGSPSFSSSKAKTSKARDSSPRRGSCGSDVDLPASAGTST